MKLYFVISFFRSVLLQWTHRTESDICYYMMMTSHVYNTVPTKVTGDCGHAIVNASVLQSWKGLDGDNANFETFNIMHFW